MYSKRAVTLALTLLLLSSCVSVWVSLNLVENRDVHVRITDLVTGDGVDIRSRFAGGDGSAGDPYLISNVTQLQDMDLNLKANYVLINDIDASETREWNNGAGFEPIANQSDNYYGKRIFDGTINGNGFIIYNLFINRSIAMHVGFIRELGYNGFLSNITLIASEVYCNSSVGGLVGENNGKVQNCYVTGNVIGNYDVGGLIGLNDYGTVQNCFAAGNVSGNRYVGALVGRNNHGTVQNCSASGTSYGKVIPNSSEIGTDTGGDSTGGLMGYNEGMVHNCSATGTITGGDDVGGLVGENRGAIQNSSAIGTITGGHGVGGLVGENEGTVQNCSATGNISGVQFIGGLVGKNEGTLRNCSTMGNISGYWDIGGLMGHNKFKIINSFYCINSTTINQKNVITPYGIYKYQFDQWLSNGKKLNIDDYLSKNIGLDYYNIANTSDIKNILPFVAYENHKFRQTADIDISTEPNLHIPLFEKGEYDGLVSKIYKLNITNSDISNTGFFGFVGNQTIIKNVSLIDINVKGDDAVGGLVGINNGGKIQNCFAAGNVSGNVSVGGLVGENEGTIQNCTTTGNVNGSAFVGGIVGGNYGTVLNCSATSNMSGKWNVGGLVGGTNEGIVENCSATGNVRGNSNVGGLVGGNDGMVQNCFAAGNVTGNRYVGGLVGDNYERVQNCSATGIVSGDRNVGGLVGENGGTIQNCTATNNVSGEQDIGGLVGSNHDLIENSFYCINTTTINRKNIITPYGIDKKQFDQWLGNDKTLNIVDYFSKIIGSDYYNIANTSDMKNLLPFAAFDGYQFRQTADIDMSSEPNLYIALFNAGEYDGSGYIISNLNVNISEISKVGLFGRIGSEAKIANASLLNINVNGNDYVGGFAGCNLGMVQNIKVTGDVSGNNDIGGLVGWNSRGIVENCSATSNVTGGVNVGGLVGMNYDEIKNCTFSGHVSGNDGVGGLVGINYHNIENSSSSVNVFGNVGIGGLVGLNIGNIISSFSEGKISGNIGQYFRIVGGFVGTNSGEIKQCYSKTNVSGSDSVGGFVGLNSHLLGWGVIENCYTKSIVSGNISIGGFVGLHTTDLRYLSVIENCYSSGKVYGNYSVGGFLSNETDALVVNSFWDMGTSGQSNGNGGIDKTTIEMMTKSTFTDAGWDFVSIWEINEYVDYPYFQWETRPNFKAQDTDNDSIPDIIDDFPIDPAASIDTDSDGYPDDWNPGTSESVSTTGLHLDAFPSDPAASLDSDNDGMPDEWNPGMNRSDSTSNPPLDIDPYPNDPDNKVPKDIPLMIWILVSLGVVFVILIAVFIAVSVRRKRKLSEKEEKDNIGRIELNNDK